MLQVWISQYLIFSTSFKQLVFKASCYFGKHRPLKSKIHMKCISQLNAGLNGSKYMSVYLYTVFYPSFPVCWYLAEGVWYISNILHLWQVKGGAGLPVSIHLSSVLFQDETNTIFTESAHWADSVI